MPEVNLSTLRDRELRQLLDSARQRGQASLSYMILQEMEARRTNGGREKPARKSSARRPAEPRIVPVDLNDPLEQADEFAPEAAWDPPAQAQSEPQDAPARPPPDEPPLQFERTRPPPPERPRARSRSGWGALLFALGLALGLAGGWKAAEYAYAPRLAKAAAAEVTPPSAPPPQPVAAPPGAAPETAAVAPEGQAPDAAQPAPQAAEAAPETPPPAAAPAPPPAEAEDQPQAQAAEEGRSAQPKAIRCSSEPTPAAQAICRDPRLQRLQRELRQAYAEALEAHQDRALLRERQLAWADARDAVGDPDRLAQLYEERIRRLNAATAEALREK